MCHGTGGTDQFGALGHLPIYNYFRSKAMGLRNKLFRRIKRSLLEDGVFESEALELARKAVKDRSESLIYPGGQMNGIGVGYGQPFRDMCNIEEIECNATTPFRTIDGTCNNLESPAFGAMCTPFIRSGVDPLPFDPIEITQNPDKIEVYSSNGPCVPRQTNYPPDFLPSPRLVSTSIFLDNDLPDNIATHMVTQFAQSVDHDTTFTPEEEEEDCCNVSPDFHNLNEKCAPIKIPLDDPFFSNLAEPQVCLPLARSLRFCEGHEEREGNLHLSIINLVGSWRLMQARSHSESRVKIFCLGPLWVLFST